MTPFFLKRNEHIELQISRYMYIVPNILILFFFLWHNNIEFRRGSEKYVVLCCMSFLCLWKSNKCLFFLNLNYKVFYFRRAES